MSERPVLHLNTVLTPLSDGLIGDEQEGRLTLLHLASGKYYELTPVAAHIWNLLTVSGSLTVADVCDRLVARYDVERSTCEKEVIRLMTDLSAEGLVGTHA